MVSRYWQNQGKTEADRRPGKVFQRSDGLACAECCTKMFPQEGPCSHFHRDSCPFCMGTSLNASCFDANGKRLKVECVGLWERRS
jgi:hypothetical protein